MPEAWVHTIIEVLLGVLVYAGKVTIDGLKKDQREERERRIEEDQRIERDWKASAKAQGRRIGECEQGIQGLNFYLAKRSTSPAEGTPAMRARMPSQSNEPK